MEFHALEEFFKLIFHSFRSRISLIENSLSQTIPSIVRQLPVTHFTHSTHCQPKFIDEIKARLDLLFAQNVSLDNFLKEWKKQIKISKASSWKCRVDVGVFRVFDFTAEM